ELLHGRREGRLRRLEAVEELLDFGLGHRRQICRFGFAREAIDETLALSLERREVLTQRTLGHGLLLERVFALPRELLLGHDRCLVDEVRHGVLEFAAIELSHERRVLLRA